MFKEILKAWRGESLLNDMLRIFDKMLDDTRHMYNRVTGMLFENKGRETTGKGIYQADGRVNSSEREIRRMLVEHLSISHRDLGPCLVLMSTVKDVERIGDYCKNLFEILALHPGKLADDRYVTEMRKIAREVGGLFDVTRKAFRESDEKLAGEMLSKNQDILKKCDGVLEKLVEDQVPTRQAVAYTLIARHLKRIGSHLGNITSSVVLPLHQIDYPSKMQN
ncbi:MAG: PhoU domain-containing protein [Acidobacteriota bacterium]